jgi:hypothetical protein
MKPERLHSITSERPLEGIAVGISIAYGEDSASRAFTQEEMNSSVVRLADALLSAGARLVFGHDWRPNGVMAAVADLAVRYEPSMPLAVPETCRITNLVPWDRRAELPENLREDLQARGILRVEEIPLPESLLQREVQVGKRTLRAAALSLLRQRLADLCHARVCLGGKYMKYEGFWPGILEEAWTAARKRQPVFLSGMLGGAASLVLQASRTGNWSALTSGNPDENLRRSLALIRESRVIDLPNFDRCEEIMNWEQLQMMSDLPMEDWQRLAQATDIAVVIALALKGLVQARTSR